MNKHQQGPVYIPRVFELIRIRKESKVLKILKSRDGNRLKNAIFIVRPGGNEIKGKTILMQAAEAGSTKIVNQLLELGASIDARDSRERHVLLHACLHGASPAMIDCLLRWNDRHMGQRLLWTDFDCERKGALILACESGNVTTVSHVAWKLVRQNYGGAAFTDANDAIYALSVAIGKGFEDVAVELFTFDDVRERFRNESHDGSNDSEQQQHVSCVKCVAVAKKKNMVSLLSEMGRINPSLTENGMGQKINDMDLNSLVSLQKEFQETKEQSKDYEFNNNTGEEARNNEDYSVSTSVLHRGIHQEMDRFSLVSSLQKEVEETKKQMKDEEEEEEEKEEFNDDEKVSDGAEDVATLRFMNETQREEIEMLRKELKEMKQKLKKEIEQRQKMEAECQGAVSVEDASALHAVNKMHRYELETVRNELSETKQKLKDEINRRQLEQRNALSVEDASALQAVGEMQRNELESTRRELDETKTKLKDEIERGQKDLKAFAQALSGVDELRKSAELMSQQLRNYKTQKKKRQVWSSSGSMQDDEMSVQTMETIVLEDARKNIKNMEKQTLINPIWDRISDVVNTSRRKLNIDNNNNNNNNNSGGDNNNEAGGDATSQTSGGGWSWRNLKDYQTSNSPAPQISRQSSERKVKFELNRWLRDETSKREIREKCRGKKYARESSKRG